LCGKASKKGIRTGLSFSDFKYRSCESITMIIVQDQQAMGFPAQAQIPALCRFTLRHFVRSSTRSFGTRRIMPLMYVIISVMAAKRKRSIRSPR
jgi:hypothetical protein